MYASVLFSQVQSDVRSDRVSVEQEELITSLRNQDREKNEQYMVRTLPSYHSLNWKMLCF